MKGIKYGNKRADAPPPTVESIAQRQTKEPSRNWGMDDMMPRSDEAPTSAGVPGWPYPQYSQTHRKEPSYDYDETFPRSAKEPTKAEVVGWPYPQFSQIHGKEPSYDYDETFPRSAKEPTKSEVVGWPFPSNLSQEPSPDYGFGEKFNRPAKAPTQAEVNGWPFPSNLAQNKQDDEDIANNGHVNHGVYDFVNDNMPSVNEVARERQAPTKAEVVGWPYPSNLAQNRDDDIANNGHVDHKVYDFVNDNMPSVNEVARERQAPTKSDVAGWPL